MVKIGPVDPKVTLLKGLFLEEEINASRTYSPLCIHAAGAKLQLTVICSVTCNQPTSIQ